MLFGQRLFGNRALSLGLMLRNQARIPQVSVPSYSPDGTRQYAIGGFLPYFTSQAEEREYVSFAGYELSVPPPIRQYAMMAYPWPVYQNDLEVSDFISNGVYKVTTIPTPVTAQIPEASLGSILLWGDESGDLLLWGDESGQLLLWGDTPN